MDATWNNYDKLLVLFDKLSVKILIYLMDATWNTDKFLPHVVGPKPMDFQDYVVDFLWLLFCLVPHPHQYFTLNMGNLRYLILLKGWDWSGS
jgi:hypothetical protein